MGADQPLIVTEPRPPNVYTMPHVLISATDTSVFLWSAGCKETGKGRR